MNYPIHHVSCHADEGGIPESENQKLLIHIMGCW
jgi:hypothetical protein